MAVIDEPAAAIAASRCLTARSLSRKPGGEWTESPARRCGWCDYPPEVLAALIDGFNAWAGWSERSRTYERHDARVWAEMARRDHDEAERQIVAAQGLQPMTPLEEPPAREPGGTHRGDREPYQPSASISSGEASEPVFLPDVDEELAWTT